MEFEIKEKEILNKIGVDVFSENRNYWFVRTQKGTYYEDFLNDNFIGIEWDKISNIKEIKNSNEEDLKVEVNKQYPELERPGYVSAQIYKFCNSMKSGDIVLIPSKDSKWISFGEIVEDDIYLYEEDQIDFQYLLDEFYDESDEVCDKTLLLKRRKIKWIKTVKRTELDPYLYSIIYSHNAIVDAKPYSIFIDRTLSRFYIKGNEAYYTYKVNKKQNIPYNDVLSFLNNNNKLIEYISSKSEKTKIDINDLVLKINVQSKGPIQLKGTVKNILIIGLITGALFGVDMNIEAFGLKYGLKTDGLPKLITNIMETYDKIKDDKENRDLQSIIENLEKDKEKLEIELAADESINN
ncbi:hypothetical protein [uncultured Clostridium sp.]|uniref:hypothetical protein n=1 Tax=uncultured Clostridium sp. TaxID=59620 RepID=UPI0028F0B97A|nr:hypothetical protein [uncultured Clostridium sp.]